MIPRHDKSLPACDHGENEVLTVNRHNLKALTGARFFAALAVLAFHFSINNSAGLPWYVTKIIEHGNFGVNFFFTLSGFIIAYNYVGTRFEVRSFWRSRFARVYPLYLLALLISVPFFIQSMHGWSVESVLNIIRRFTLEALLVQSWYPLDGDAINDPGWSISAEAFFYLLFPLVAAYLSTRATRKTLIFAGITFAIAIAV